MEEGRQDFVGDRSKLILEVEVMEVIRRRATEAFPEECCGLLVGTLDPAKGYRNVSKARATQNAFEPSERYHRFTIDPKEFLAVERELEGSGEEVVGVYHSHPNAPAKPSEYDRRHAWPGYSYLVLEVRDGRVADARSWALREDRGAFEEERLEVTR
jgi:proteasome lid subunit RPN8/RPN11